MKISKKLKLFLFAGIGTSMVVVPTSLALFNHANQNTAINETNAVVLNNVSDINNHNEAVTKNVTPIAEVNLNDGNDLTSYKSENSFRIVNTFYNNANPGKSFFESNLKTHLQKKYKELGLTVNLSDIILANTMSYNTSKGEVYVRYEVRNTSSTNFNNINLTIKGFRQIGATSIQYINDPINSAIRSSIEPSNLQNFLDQKWYNIFYLINISNGYNSNAQEWIPYVASGATYINNQSFNLAKIDKYTQEQINNVKTNSTYLSANVVEHNDGLGTALVDVAVTNFYSDKNDVPLNDDNSPIRYFTNYVRLNFVGLGSFNIRTQVIPEIKVTDLNPEWSTLYAYQLLNNINKSATPAVNGWDFIISKFVKNSPNTIRYKLISSYANNKEGTIFIQFRLENALDNNGMEVDISAKPLYFTTELKGLVRVQPSRISINTAGYDIKTDSNFIKTINEVLASDKTSINFHNTRDFFNGLINPIGTFPPEENNVNTMNGNISNVNIQNNTATINMKIYAYFSGYYKDYSGQGPNDIYSYRNNLSVSMDIKANANQTKIFITKLTVYKPSYSESGSTNNSLTTIEYYDPFSSNESNKESNYLSPGIIALIVCSSVIGFIVFTVIIYYLLKWYKSKK